MLIKILLIVAIVIQTIATLFAIRLIRTTKYNSIWILFTIGFTLLSVERVVQFLRANGQTLPYEVFVWLGLVISISMSIGVMYAHKLFKYIARLNRQRQLLNKRIDGRAAHRGEIAVAFREGFARRAGAVALVGPYVAVGPATGVAAGRSAGDHR